MIERSVNLRLGVLNMPVKQDISNFNVRFCRVGSELLRAHERSKDLLAISGIMVDFSVILGWSYD